MNIKLIILIVVVIVIAIIVLRGELTSGSRDYAYTDIDHEALAIESYKEDINTDNLEEALYQKIKSQILSWTEEDIYAISFFVENNMSYEYNGYENVSMWSISYNTEDDCDGAGKCSEERWNYAFWKQDEYPIIDIEIKNKYTDVLYDWYAENGITNIGVEDTDNEYDDEMNYIGKGPAGHYELLQIAANVGMHLQKEGVIKKRFGKPVPIIVHGLEYAWYDIEATKKANPSGEADTFLTAAKKLGIY